MLPVPGNKVFWRKDAAGTSCTRSISGFCTADTPSRSSISKFSGMWILPVLHVILPSNQVDRNLQKKCNGGWNNNNYLKVISGPVSCVELPKKTRQDTRKERKARRYRIMPRTRSLPAPAPAPAPAPHDSPALAPVSESSPGGSTLSAPPGYRHQNSIGPRRSS